MSVIVLGFHHRSAPLELLERLAVAPERLPKILHDLVSRDHVSEAVVLSTCNRVEVYAQVETFHGAVHDARNALAEQADLRPDDIADFLYTFHDAAAVAHLFTVAAGLDSVVLGETEILGQVKGAWEEAMRERATGPALNMLFRHALEAGKRVRTETGIARATTSLAHAAVALVADRLAPLEGRRALVVGAGAMGERMAVGLAAAGAEVLVANRSADRAEALAGRVGGAALSIGQVPATLAEVDVLLTATGSSRPLVERSELEPVLTGRPLLVVDVAVPRNVDPRVGDLAGVSLLDMDDLRTAVGVGLAERRQEVTRARDLVDDEVARYRDAVSARHVAPVIASMRQRAEAVRVAEVTRLGRRLGDKEREAFDLLSRTLVAKLLHDPTVRLKEASGSVRGDRLAEALRDLFDL